MLIHKSLNQQLSRKLCNSQKWLNIQNIIKETFIQINTILEQFQIKFRQFEEQQKNNTKLIKQKKYLIEDNFLKSNMNKQFPQELTNYIEQKFTVMQQKLNVKLNQKLNQTITQFNLPLQTIRFQYNTLISEVAKKVNFDDLEKNMKKLQKKNEKIQIKIPEQQLYIQSSQTIFSMIIEQVNNIKNKQKTMEENISKKNKATRDLNNQLCEKLIKIERQIQVIKNSIMLQNKKSGSIKKSQYNNQYQVIKSMNINQIIHEMQKQLHQKVNLKDLLSLIMNNINPIQQEINSLKIYFENNLQSTHKILNHQTIINQQICKQMKIGKWEWLGYSNPKLNMIPWEKQSLNLYPQCMMWSKNTSTLIIKDNGLYHIKILLYQGRGHIGLILNNRQIKYDEKNSDSFGHIYEDIIKLQKNTSISVTYDGKNGKAILILKKI